LTLKFHYYINNVTGEELFAIDQNYMDNIKPHYSILRNDSKEKPILDGLKPPLDLNILDINLLADVKIDIKYAKSKLI
jgi:hypothetical protein